ncbi:MAG: AN1-type zinc finger domain-containing protein [Candidatus Thorarchaeota archaeon]
MSNCYFCNKKFDDIPYRCTFCGMLFCSKHRLPENHECPFDLRKSSEIEDSFNRLDLLYQDALDFMNKDLTVAKIYDYVTTKQMNDLEATELLSYFIENSDDVETRKISIQALKVLKLKNKYVFNTLESCILSEDNPDVRKTAIDVIKYIFPKKSQIILKWILNHNKHLN